jgi:hypothetical protein
LKKYLIILSGSPRGSEYAWKSLIKYVKKPLNADLAVSYGDKYQLPKYLDDNADFNWIFNEPSNWRTYYETEFSNTWEDFLIKGKDLGMAGGIDNHPGSGAIVSALKDIIYKNYLETLQEYDYIIHSRFDQLYSDEHPVFEGDNIWIPTGEDYFGICDRHAIFPSKFSKQYFSICEYINNPKSIQKHPKYVSPESVFEENLIYNNLDHLIVRYPRSQFTVSHLDDATRWRVAKYRLYFFKNLSIKYPDEFIESIYNRLQNHSIYKVTREEFLLFINYLNLTLRRKLGEYKRNLFKF